MERTVKVKDFSRRLSGAVRVSALSGMRTAAWFMKITLPISLGIAIFEYLGVIEWVSLQLAPLFRVVGLQGEAAFVWLSAALGNVYTGLAVMITVGVDYRSAIILAAMGLVCHNLILETAIQRKSGASALWMPVIRIAGSFVCAFALNLILPAGLAGQLRADTATVAQASSWSELFRIWGLSMLPLLVRMFVLIVGLNIVQGMLREFRILDLLTYPLRPLMRIFGLPYSTSFLWLICNVIGLAYGGAALIEEVQHGKATPEDARLLNTHVAMSHSLLEDTSIYWSLGVPVFWLVIPRLAMAVTAVWIQRLGRALIARGRVSGRMQEA